MNQITNKTPPSPRMPGNADIGTTQAKQIAQNSSTLDSSFFLSSSSSPTSPNTIEQQPLGNSNLSNLPTLGSSQRAPLHSDKETTSEKIIAEQTYPCPPKTQAFEVKSLGNIKNKVSTEIGKQLSLLEKQVSSLICLNKKSKKQIINDLMSLKNQALIQSSISQVKKVITDKLDCLVASEPKNPFYIELITALLDHIPGSDQLSKIPNPILVKLITSYLDHQSALNLFSTTFYLHGKQPDARYIIRNTRWKNECLSLDLDALAFSLLQPDNLIDYRALYGKLKILPKSIELKPWMICLMAGKEDLIKKNMDLFTADSLSDANNALHFAAMGGSIAAMKRAIEILGIPKDSKNGYGQNALHMAAWSGSMPAMEYAHKTLEIIPKNSINNDGSDGREGINALHFAAWSGSIPAIEYAIEILKIPKNSKDNWGRNALHFAAWSGSIPAMKYAHKILETPKNSTGNSGKNVLHFAAWGGSIPAMKYAHETLGIPKDSKNGYSQNALHFAAWGGSIPAIKYAIETLGIPKNSTDYFGQNALHFAGWSGSIPSIKYAIEILEIPKNSIDNNGKNVLYYARQSGSKKAIEFIEQA